MRRTSQFSLVAAAALLAAGCTTTEEIDVHADEFEEGQGQAPLPDAIATYPEQADWGVDVGHVIPNWSFVGFANRANPELLGVQMLGLSEFYNPHGYELAACVEAANAGCGDADQACLDAAWTGCVEQFPTAVYPEGSPFAGQAKPRALSVGISAVWCPPCNQEAKSLLNPMFAEYSAKGGHFVIALLDGPDQGKAATLADADKWVTRYQIEYTLVTDPRGDMSLLFDGFLPSSAIIRTSDMRIMMAIDGAPTPAFWGLLDQVLVDPNVEPKH